MIHNDYINSLLFESPKSALKYEEEIFYEYQKFPIETYRIERIKFIKLFLKFIEDVSQKDKLIINSNMYPICIQFVINL
jgi:hypothetical protein